MNESLLSYFWKTRCFPQQCLKTTHNEEISIISPGMPNSNQGPDFLMAKIRIGEVLWVGQVEIHVMSSDWLRHGHQSDPNYQNVVLHVVWEDDLPEEKGLPQAPVLQLKDYISPNLIDLYQNLTGAKSQIACISLLNDVEPIHLSAQIESASVERLEEKAERMATGLRQNGSDWDALFYIEICRYLNSPVNAPAAEELTKRLSWKLILRTREDLFRLESLVLGCAGLLTEKAEDLLSEKMSGEAGFLLQKYGLIPMKGSDWHYLRMRPAHFPDLRLAQLCAFFHSLERPFHSILDCNSLDQARSLFQINPSPYWDFHYRAGGKKHAPKIKRLGSPTIDLLFINVICPMIHLFGTRQGKPEFGNLALQWLEEIPAENNKWTRIWQQTGFSLENARQSQGIIRQFRHYCEPKKCLHCKIGHRIMSRPDRLEPTYP